MTLFLNDDPFNSVLLFFCFKTHYDDHECFAAISVLSRNMVSAFRVRRGDDGKSSEKQFQGSLFERCSCVSTGANNIMNGTIWL